ncbi:phage tail protein [Aquabacterium fontiphilum]|jgi:phage tail-like protein|uniref:phage tail protein n=1 Tax=Aquabacterium fontiphilum TaxID=450365 RepID=UPI001378323D|nr:phage tail protein [Aquabacterium fontiphilum]NBD19188.1 phage tail protein [Aquabacterium fontiphilum]
MATLRNNPYGAFNFLVSLGNGDETSVIAGFSDVSGLGTEINYSEYRSGNDPVNTVRKVPNTFKQEDVTLKRGLIGSTDLFQWVKEVREGADRRRSVTITLLDEARNPVSSFKLLNAQPKKWVGPTLAAKGGGEVAMEELHLTHEGIVYE